MNQVEAEDRDIGMVFQNYALYPHMTVGRNIEFPPSYAPYCEGTAGGKGKGSGWDDAD